MCIFVQSVKLHLCRWSLKINSGPWKVLLKWLHCFVWTLPSSKTQGQSVEPGEKALWKYSSRGRRTPGYWLSPDHFQRSSKCWLLIGHRKFFVLLCPIGEQHLLSSFWSLYTMAIVSPYLSGSLTKVVSERETFIFYFPNQKWRNYWSVR